MNKIILTIVLVTIYQSITFIAANAATTSNCYKQSIEKEPNDTAITAKSISCTESTIDGETNIIDSGNIFLIRANNDSVKITDTYKISLPEKGILDLSLLINSSNSTDDLDLVILDEQAQDIIISSSENNNSNENLSVELESGSYLIGIGAFSGSSKYTLNTSFTNSDAKASIKLLSTMNNTSLSSTNLKPMILIADASNFTEKGKCNVSYSFQGKAESDQNLSLKVIPKTFSLNNKNKRKLKIKIPNTAIAKHIKENYTDPITTIIKITCPTQNNSTYRFYSKTAP